MQVCTPFLEWIEGRGDALMCAAVSNCLQRATLALESEGAAVVGDGYEAVIFLRSVASQGGFAEVACLFDTAAETLAVRLANAVGW